MDLQEVLVKGDSRVNVDLLDQLVALVHREKLVQEDQLVNLDYVDQLDLLEKLAKEAKMVNKILCEIQYVHRYIECRSTQLYNFYFTNRSARVSRFTRSTRRTWSSWSSRRTRPCWTYWT